MPDAKTAEKTPFAASVEDIESSYEFLLAYAAQGRDKEPTGPDGVAVRPNVHRLSQALGGLAVVAAGAAAETSPEVAAFVERIAEDAGRAKEAVDVALSAPNISSQLADNLNASVHLRTVLTDLFLFDEVLKAFRRAE